MAGIDPEALNKKDKADLIKLIEEQDARLSKLENQKTSLFDKKESKAVDEATNIANAFNPASITNVLNGMASAVASVANIADFEVFRELDELSTAIQANFGLAKGRVSEFKSAIADAAPELAKMGYDQEATADLIAKSMDGLKTSALLSTETLVELGAVAKVTNLNVDDLVSGFKGVGISIDEVATEMKDVADYAKNV